MWLAFAKASGEHIFQLLPADSMEKRLPRTPLPAENSPDTRDESAKSQGEGYETL